MSSADARTNEGATPPAGASRVRLDEPARAFTDRQLWVLLGITMIAAALRLLRLGEWSFWVDEAHTWRDATMPASIFWDSNRGWYPLSYQILRWWLDSGFVTHHSEGWLRLPFAFFGILSVPLLALVGNMLVGRSAALLAALMLAVNPWHIYFSQNARSYVLVFFFALLGAGVFWLSVVRRSWLLLCAAIVLVVLGVMSHPTAGLLFAPMATYAWLAQRKLDSRSLLRTGLVLLAAVLVAQALSTVPPFHEFVRAKSDPSLLHLLQTVAFYFRPSLLLVAIVGVWLLLQTRLQGRILFLSCWVIVPLLALGVLGTSLVKVTARYAFCTLPAVLLLCGAASVRIGEVLHQSIGRVANWGRLLPALVLPAIVCLDMVAYDFLYFTVQRGDRGQWRDVAEHVQRTNGSGRMLVLTINEPTMQFYLRRWHYSEFGRPDPYPEREVVSVETSEMARLGGAMAYFQELRSRARAEQKDLFVAVTLPELREKDPDGMFEKAMRENLELEAVFPIWVGPKDETIYLYRDRP